MSLMPSTECVSRQDLASADVQKLLFLCAHDSDNPIVWSAFLDRYSAKIKIFIRRTLRQNNSGFADGLQESDFFQNVVVKLVSNDFVVIKRFTGRSEEEFFAYLAVITRCVVTDCLRRQGAQKRPYNPSSLKEADSDDIAYPAEPFDPRIDRGILAQEVLDLSLRAIKNLSGGAAKRDQLIFELHYLHDLSAAQVAQCHGVGLSKAGVEKVLDRLKNVVRDAAGSGQNRTVM